ncbi:MAG TPA: hypothetical protein VLE95_02625 [Chlamydiales bacterium]|nr:hypothetical protein [Chlamydiales bacterium]
MNIIGFVLCILCILSFSAIASFQKQMDSYRLRRSYLGHFAANRQIFDQIISEFYASFKQKSGHKEHATNDFKPKTENPPPPPPPINGSCARLNLFPLIHRNIEDVRSHYETAAHILKILYGDTLFDNKAQSEYKFLDALLKEIRNKMVKDEFTALEKISFKDGNVQKMYYKMLKGTKINGYLSLLDYFKFEPVSSKICLFHAHPTLLSILFTPKGADKLYAALHASQAPAVTQESIERICQEVHAPCPPAFDLFEIKRKNHEKPSKGTFIGEDSEYRIFLRKEVIYPK